ncbi:HesB/YadR/YfhF family protein [Virgibacillus xinjiangensis]|uniref:HesB/YadR/YfhF family protein n=1 Tax=Virgibacillus xinjiangensis TaxID=393090 RepID=A0ABV7CR14_9BACI
MEIQISKEAAKWYKREMDIEEDSTSLRFYVRYGGMGGNIPGFSLGVKESIPENPHTSKKVEGLQFFIESNDAWYFDGKDLKITYSRKNDEPQFKYLEH